MKKITVVGANGNMGYNACAIFASFGDAKVYMISRDIQKSRNAIDKAIKAVKSESIRDNLIPCDYSNLAECVADSDLVYESISEVLEIKKEITKLIGMAAKKDTIIATGTSGLSINMISEVLPKKLKKNYLGIHFFNPPYSMVLLELIPCKETKVKTINYIKNYFENKLLRKVIISKDYPAFISNRIGFQFLNMALQYAEKYKNEGGINYIDSILGPFTGRTMAPCKTIDFVGLDVHKAIVNNIYKNTNDIKNATFILPNFVNKMINQGKLGNKTNGGLYRIGTGDDDKKLKYVFDIASNEYVLVKKYNFSFASKMNQYFRNGDYGDAFEFLKKDNSKEANICKEFLINYIDYSLFVAKEVCDDMESIDVAMAEGFNWCPPLALSNVLLGTNYPTKYDYRKFFKAVE